MEDSNSNEKPEGAVAGIKRRVRGLTSMSLEWLAERFRKTADIKESIKSGTYKVDSNKLAEAIINEEKK
jgi:anti-sigma28 factor (negative regulator of flagellin synthesis)